MAAVLASQPSPAHPHYLGGSPPRTLNRDFAFFGAVPPRSSTGAARAGAVSAHRHVCTGATPDGEPRDHPPTAQGENDHKRTRARVEVSAHRYRASPRPRHDRDHDEPRDAHSTVDRRCNSRGPSSTAEHDYGEWRDGEHESTLSTCGLQEDPDQYDTQAAPDSKRFRRRINGPTSSAPTMRCANAGAEKSSINTVSSSSAARRPRAQ